MLLLAIYGVPVFVIGLLVGRAWIVLVVAAFWFLAWFALVATDSPRGDGFNAIYVWLGISGTAAAALGVGLRKLVTLIQS